MSYHKDNQEFTKEQIRQIHKDVGYANPMQLGYTPIIETSMPTITELQKAIPNGWEVREDGLSYRVWELVYKSLEECKEIKIQEIKNGCTADNPITLTVDFINSTQKDITFNGGSGSASAIVGAVELAQALGESEVSLWDLSNTLHHGISFAEAMEISVLIAKKYRDDMYKRQDLLTQINEATTIDELGSISWQS